MSTFDALREYTTWGVSIATGLWLAYSTWFKDRRAGAVAERTVDVAEDDLSLRSLQAALGQLEKDLGRVSTALDEERRLRQAAQARVLLLEDALRAAGIPIPATHAAD